MRICVCNSLVPFAHGGAELHVDGLCRALRERGFTVELVTLPFSWHDKLHLVDSALAWRLVDLRGADGIAPDLVIATRFPSYLVRHPNKVVWLIHQFRQAYDLLGTAWSDFGAGPEDQRALELVRNMDATGFREARAIFTNARNTADRLRRFNGFTGLPLYPPPPLAPRYFEGPHGDALLSVGRLDPLKRVHLLLETLAACRQPLRARIIGTGPEEPALRALETQLGLTGRVDWLGRVDDDTLLREYASALAVFYAPLDEDFGYVTVEALLSGRPVLTARDSGGPLEFLRDGENGVVADPGRPQDWAAVADAWYENREHAAAAGRRGRQAVQGIHWDGVVEALTGRTDGGTAP